ncbi:MAG: hypothetical protein MK015_08565, partial [Alphaproteobacteria bacterium]|nr:hypothetical protein [Alphaproteobacteria bacterium]
PPARFGSLSLEGSNVLSFAENLQLKVGWINGGYFVFEPERLSNNNSQNFLVILFLITLSLYSHHSVNRKPHSATS